VSGPLPPDDVARFLARCQTEWAAAGLPDHVTDPAVIDRIAATVVANPAPARRARTNRTTAVDD
jgi:hypothetical protein